eukprot:COSAG05_NODE_48_length_24425_cov_90.438543_13_plen_59_part_00
MLGNALHTCSFMRAISSPWRSLSSRRRSASCCASSAAFSAASAASLDMPPPVFLARAA